MHQEQAFFLSMWLPLSAPKENGEARKALLTPTSIVYQARSAPAHTVFILIWNLAPVNKNAVSPEKAERPAQNCPAALCRIVASSLKSGTVYPESQRGIGDKIDLFAIRHGIIAIG